jgi:bilin biosynthesis protein
LSIEEKYPNLRHENPKIREETMEQIAEEYTEETISQLITILDSEDVTYRRTVTQTLGLIGVDALPFLVQELDNNDNFLVRASCVQALGAIAYKDRSQEQFSTEALNSLQKAIEDPHPVVQLASIGALSIMGASAFEILEQALNIPNILVQVAVVSAFGSLGDERGLEILSSLAKDETVDPYLKESAGSALSRLEQIIKVSPR